MNRKLILLAACLSLAACAPKKTADAAAYDVSIPLKEVMAHVVDPGAWGFWNYTGDVVDAKGTHSRVPIDPKTIPDVPGMADDERRVALDKQWTDAESGTVQLIEVSNVLQLPGYVRKLDKNDDGDWVKFAQKLNGYAHDAQDAVEARDGQKMFDTGGQIFQVCTDCHAKYLLPFIDPKTGEIPDGVTPGGEPTQARKKG